MSSSNENQDRAADAAKSAECSRVVLSLLMGPNDANAMGNVHGGSIMRLVDEAGALAAVRHARSRVVTVQLDSMSFLEPVYVGDLLTLTAMVNWVGRTSIEVGVRVEAEDPVSGARTHTNSAYAVYVAIDRHGRSQPVPPLRIESEEQQRRWDRALARREQRLKHKRQAEEERKES
ncbi:MAG: acyl-CoA thioesterase [Ardenticatenaceae bacterium]